MLHLALSVLAAFIVAAGGTILLIIFSTPKQSKEFDESDIYNPKF
jgi:hypothetical protein